MLKTGRAVASWIVTFSALGQLNTTLLLGAMHDAGNDVVPAWIPGALDQCHDLADL
jgi:hypothetical protein